MPNSMSNWATAQKSATTARMNAVLCSSKSESEVQVQSVTVTPLGHGKSVTVTDCHSNSMFFDV